MPTFMTTTMRFSGDAFLAGAPPVFSGPVKPERMKHELLHEAMIAQPRAVAASVATSSARSDSPYACRIERQPQAP